MNHFWFDITQNWYLESFFLLVNANEPTITDEIFCMSKIQTFSCFIVLLFTYETTSDYKRFDWD